MNKISLPMAIAYLVLTGCSSVKNEGSICKITPPEFISSSRIAAEEAAADLSRFAELPATADTGDSIKYAFDATFQKVPDTEAACAMLSQAYACISDAERASEFKEYMQNSSPCGKR